MPVNVDAKECEEEMQGDKSSEDEAQEEGRRPKVIRDPGQPTKQEWLEHQATHIPTRSWCPHCVRGKSVNRQHKRKTEAEKEEEEHKMLRIVMDY